MNMSKKLIGILLLVLFSSTMFAARSGNDSKSDYKNDNKEYYTQYNIWLFKNQATTLNYAVDALVPVNTKVKIIKEYDDKLELQTDGNEFTVAIARKYSKKSITDLKAQLLSDAPVDLSKFSNLGREAIKRGEIKPGMTKQEVLVARGYPPEHATLSINSDTWRYWESKWKTMLVYFENNKVVDIKG